MERRVAVQTIKIDRGKMLKDEPHTGHNRWHPEVEPKIEVDCGEEVVLETRDACDGQIRFGDSLEAVSRIARGVVHPLTGPVYVKGAEPGDLLEVECLDVLPEAAGWTRISPGMGFLRDVFLEPYLVHWSISDGWATSEMLPGVRIPYGAFMGTAGVAPSHAQLEEWTRREAALMERGGMVLPPDPTGRGACRRRCGGTWAADAAAEGERGERGREADDERVAAVRACGGGGGVVFGGGRALRTGRLGVLRDGNRDGGDAGGQVSGAQGRGGAEGYSMAAILARRLFPAAGVGRAASVHGDDGDARHGGWGEPGGGS